MFLSLPAREDRLAAESSMNRSSARPGSVSLSATQCTPS